MFGENLRKAPLIRVVIPFGAGIGMGTVFENSISLIILVLSLILCSLLLLIFYRISRSRNFNWLFGIIFIPSLFFLGLIFENISQARLFPLPPEPAGDYCKLRIKEHVKVRADWNVFIAECMAERIENRWCRKDVNIQLYLSTKFQSDSFMPGDKLIVKAQLIRTSEPSNPGEFNYRKFYDRKGIWGSGYLKDSSTIISYLPSNVFSLENITSKIQGKFLNVFRNLKISGDELALLSALTIGVRDQLDNEINKAFSASGAMHILSVSGLHVGIVYLVFARLLSFLGKRRYAKILAVILQITFLWFYAILTGLSPAVNRAAAMFSFLALGKSLNRSASSLNIVAGSALVLLLFNPFLLFDLGFQLSYMAVISIILFQSFIYNLIEFKNYFVNQIWKLVALSISAQLGTFPLSLIYFHQFPNYFILTNLLVVPLAAIILYLAISLIFLSWLPYVAPFLGWSLNISLKGMIFSVKLIEHLPYSLSHDLSLNRLQFLLLYSLILSFAIFIHFRLKGYLFVCIIILSVFLSSLVINQFNCYNSWHLVVFNQPGSSLILASKGTTGTILYSGKNIRLLDRATNLVKSSLMEWKVKNIHWLCMDSLSDNEVYGVSKNIEVCRNGNCIFFNLAHKKIAFIRGIPHNKERLNLINPEILILSSISRSKDLEFIKDSNIHTLILDSSCRFSKDEGKASDVLKKMSVLHEVSVSGAFVLTN